MSDDQVVIVVVCGAGPAPEVDKLVRAAQARGWTVGVIATPAALDFIDTEKLESLTGLPVRSEYRLAGEPRRHTLPPRRSRT